MIRHADSHPATTLEADPCERSPARPAPVVQSPAAIARLSFAMNELSWLEIRLDRLDDNIAHWRRTVGRSRICAVVKAGAYGLGAVPIARRLQLAGVDMLAVYTPAQAEELLDADIRRPILVLQPTRELEHTAATGDAVDHDRLHLAINDPTQLDLADRLGRSWARPVPVHIHLDTGMCRAGLNDRQFDLLLDDVPRYIGVRVAGVWSHMASADDDPAFANDQLARLDAALDRHRHALPPGLIVHAANTFAACRGSRFHRGMVRIGLGLYGYGPELMTDAPGDPGIGSPVQPDLGRDDPALPAPALRPVIRWAARIIHLQHYPAGATVGYNRTYRLTRDSLLGVVPVGYADGYPVALSNKGVVRLCGPLSNSRPHPQRSAACAPILGKVSMDQIVIDLTDADADARHAGQRPPALGDAVELLSPDPDSPCSLPRLASLAQTSPYELLCRLSPRLPRHYLDISATSVVPDLRAR